MKMRSAKNSCPAENGKPNVNPDYIVFAADSSQSLCLGIARREVAEMSESKHDMEPGFASYAATQLATLGQGRPHPPLLPKREKYVVDFDGPDDPAFPQNWPMRTR